MIKDAQFEDGLALRREMFGPRGSDDQIDAVGELDEKLQEFVTRQCFGDVWQGPGLDRRTRSLITVGMLIALGRSHEISVHMTGAIANGVTPAELSEVVLHSALYAGLPAAMEGNRHLAQLVAASEGER